jgi:hypothetical protein
VGQGLEALVRLGDADQLQQLQRALGRDFALSPCACPALR